MIGLVKCQQVLANETDHPTHSNHSTTEPTFSKSKPVILVLGDSLSAAHGINPKEGWVSLLEQRLQDKGYSYQVINSSISGILPVTANPESNLYWTLTIQQF